MGFSDRALEQDQQSCGGPSVIAENCLLGITRSLRKGLSVAHLALKETGETTNIHFSEDKLKISSFSK